ncbi:MAG: hypothetical protein Q9M92_13075 [Enterobacterales bacterium]|nr:hypothetical protein [Enterobacterales bacterium]
MNIKTTSLANLGLVIILAGAPLVANAVEKTINKSFEVKAGGDLYVNSDSGKISVQAWDKKQVQVKVTKKARKGSYVESFKVNLEQNGNDISIEGFGEWNTRVKVSYQIKVPKNFNLNLETGGGAIEIGDMSGMIKAETSGGAIKVGNIAKGSVDVDTSGGRIEIGNVKGNVKAETSGGAIVIGHVSGKTSLDTSGGSIKVASAGDKLEAETSGGSIKIGPSKSDVKVGTSGGSIKIAMSQGNVEAETSGGQIRVEGAKGNVSIDSSGGNLFVGQSGGHVKADTSGGNITIKKAKGYIEADTSGGSIDVEMIQTDNRKDHHVDLDSSGGTITLYLPKSIKATISAKIKLSHSARRDYRIYSDFPLTIEGENSSRVSGKGKINGGGDKVKINTSNGDIYIKMLKD